MRRKDIKLLVENWRRLLREEKLSEEELVEKYVKESKYNITEKKGNCGFFAYDFGKFCNELGGLDVKIVYTWHKDSFSYKEGDDIEDHIIAMVDGKIYDFVQATPVEKQGSVDRTKPEKQDLTGFEKNGYYGKKGYLCYYVENNPNFSSPESIFNAYDASRVKCTDKKLKIIINKNENSPPWPPSCGIDYPSKKRM